MDFNRITSRFTSNARAITTSGARNRVLRCNRWFLVGVSFVAASRRPLVPWIIQDRGGPSKSEGIGFGIRVAGLGQVGRNRPSNQSVRAINQAECSQSLLPTPEAEVLAGVKGPRIGSGWALGGPGN